MATIARNVDEFGVLVLSSGSRKVYVSAEHADEWYCTAESGGVTMHAFVGHYYTSQARAVKAAEKWLVARCSND